MDQKQTSRDFPLHDLIINHGSRQYLDLSITAARMARDTASSFASKGPSIKYVTLEGREGVREGVTVCDRGVGG